MPEMKDPMREPTCPVTEKAIIALLAAFAREHSETFRRFCEVHGENAEAVMAWRIGDWADDYHSLGFIMDGNGSVPLFEIGPAGSPRLDPLWTERVAGFCEAVRRAVGRHPRVQCWPYRAGNAACVALDIAGEAGEISLTLLESDGIDIPMEGTKLGSRDPRISDAVDAFYLVSVLLESLGLSSSGDAVVTVGPRTTRRPRSCRSGGPEYSVGPIPTGP
jgi:hypothetical protein